jgi:hypothetical protein
LRRAFTKGAVPIQGYAPIKRLRKGSVADRIRCGRLGLRAAFVRAARQDCDGHSTPGIPILAGIGGRTTIGIRRVGDRTGTAESFDHVEAQRYEFEHNGFDHEAGA